jgi:hypothetical protein
MSTTAEQWGSAHEKLLNAVHAIETPLGVVIGLQAPGADVPPRGLTEVMIGLASEVQEAIDGEIHKLALRLLWLEQLSSAAREEVN